MKSASLVGIVLIALGIMAFVFQGFTYTTREKAIDLGPLQVTKEEKKTVPLPPVLGGIALVGGIALLIAGSRSNA